MSLMVNKVVRKDRKGWYGQLVLPVTCLEIGTVKFEETVLHGEAFAQAFANRHQHPVYVVTKDRAQVSTITPQAENVLAPAEESELEKSFEDDDIPF